MVGKICLPTSHFPPGSRLCLPTLGRGGQAGGSRQRLSQPTYATILAHPSGGCQALNGGGGKCGGQGSSGRSRAAGVRLQPVFLRKSRAWLARISRQEQGRAGLQPRRHKNLRNNPAPRSPSSLRPQAARGAGQTGPRGRDFGGAEAPPFQPRHNVVRNRG
jgi:hypothetical protein